MGLVTRRPEVKIPPPATKQTGSAHCCPQQFRVRPDYQGLYPLEAGKGPEQVRDDGSV